MKRLLSVKFWGVLGLLLVLAVTTLAQEPINVVIMTFEVVLAGPDLPVAFNRAPFVRVTIRDAVTGDTAGPITSNSNAEISVALTRNSFYYFVAEKDGFRPTASFIFQAVAEGQAFYAPIVSDSTYAALLSLGANADAHQSPKRSMILALFHPEGRLPTRPIGLHWGVVVDARSLFRPFPNVVQVVPFGERRFLGRQGNQIRLVHDYRIPGFVPCATIIYNAGMYVHPLYTPVWAYRFDRLHYWPLKGPVYLFPLAPAAAPTPTSITVGVVQLSKKLPD